MFVTINIVSKLKHNHRNDRPLHTNIEKLFTSKTPKYKNDIVSIQRERMLHTMLTKKHIFQNRTDFIGNMIHNLEITMKDYNDCEIYHKGGRNHDYDFHLYNPSNNQFTKLEYKVSTNKNISIFDQPQITSLSTESRLCTSFIQHDFTYLEYTYYNTIPEIPYFDTPSIDDYIKITKSTTPKKKIDERWFQYLVELRKLNKRKYDYLFKRSITNYIYGLDFDLDLMCEWFKDRHRNKIIMNQYREHFIIEECNEIFDIESLEFIDLQPHHKNPNKLIVKTNSDFDIQLYMRWKNGIGLQNPAVDFKPIKRF